MHKGQKSKESASLAMMAAALQDHRVQNLQRHHLMPQQTARGRTGSMPNNRNPSEDKHGAGRNGRKVKLNFGARPPRLGWALETEEEYVLGPSQPPLTLAQKLGLVEAPPAPLTTEEWSQVKSRSAQEGDSGQPCVICREEFRLQPQVLLSCSHVFHMACLQAFERFSGKRCCPMCRREQYETRVIHDGARFYREKCATRIQAYWRGHVIRKWYRHMRNTVPPKDELLRRKFFEGKLQEISNSLMRSCDDDVEQFLSALDLSVEASRRAFREFGRQHLSQMKEEDWNEVQQKASQRETQDCPICLAHLRPSGEEAPGRPALLLSCSHVFHRCCLETFEGFCWEDRPVCPLCRSPYQKRAV